MPCNCKAVDRSRLPTGWNWKEYLILNPDLKAYTTERQVVAHWNAHGQKEGRKWSLPVDQHEKYLEKYPDLKRNGVNTKEKALTHFLTNGRREGRSFM